MKLFSFDVDRRNTDAARACIESAIRSTDLDIVRVEIHSLDDSPWPTERPDGWGVGWWCEVSGRQAGICRRLYGDPSALQVEIVFPFDGYWVAGCLITGYMNIIVTSYGPKMEIPR